MNLILGAYGVQSGELTPGDVVFLQTIMLQLLAPLTNISNMYREWTDS